MRSLMFSNVAGSHCELGSVLVVCAYSMSIAEVVVAICNVNKKN